MGAHTIHRSARSPAGETQVVLDSIRRIVQMLRASSAEAQRIGGLSGAQLFVLEKLADCDGLSVNELARRTLTHQSSVSVVASKLHERGLVDRERSGVDARQVRLRITPAGKKLLARAPRLAQDQLIDAIGAMAPNDRRELARGLLALVRQAGLADGAAPLFFEEQAPAPRRRRARA